jgi:hypothetical protein
MQYDQGYLRGLYEIAQKRMESHPDITEISKKHIEKCKRFNEKEEAVKASEEMKREHPDGSYMVFTAIETDEEYYRVGSFWFVASGGEQIKAAEYVGMVSLSEYELLP